MTPLPAILVLQYAWIHICTPNCCDETTNVDPYDGHVGFGGYLDDAWFRGKDNIIEQVVVLQNIFNIIWWNLIVYLFADVQNTYDLEVWLWL